VLDDKNMGILPEDKSIFTWNPTPISRLDCFLQKEIYRGNGFTHVYALRRNIGYNLQYLEYIDRCLCDLGLSSVLRTQNCKIFIIVGCSIIESLLSYLLVKNNLYSMTEWELAYINSGSEKSIDGKKERIDSYVYKKLTTPIRAEMTFDTMLKKAEARKVLGDITNLYPRLNYLRKLRNKIHLQEIAHPTDTDWNSFNMSDFSAMADVLHTIFTGNIFRSSSDEKKYFSYLEKYIII